MSACVIDTGAVLAHLQNEDGADAALGWMDKGAIISALNLQEVVSKLVDGGTDREGVEQSIAELDLDVHALTEPLAIEAGLMRAQTKRRGLSHGDRACLILAKLHGLPAVTTDREWSDIADDVGVEVVQIR